MAPILSFTAEEAWQLLRPADATIFVHTWPQMIPDVADADALLDKWQKILAVRDVVLKKWGGGPPEDPPERG